MFVFDTETRVDATQRLTFGCYRYIIGTECVEEGFFYADDLPGADRRILDKYVRNHWADTAPSGKQRPHLLNRKEFLDRLFLAAYKARALVVGFNLPFDLSRLGFDVANARGDFGGGFSLGLWSYKTKSGHERRNSFKPRIGIKHVDSKRALLGFTARKKPDSVDLIPEGSATGKPEKGYRFRGHFLDLRTLAFALTDRGHSLESACLAFGVEHGKLKVSTHGQVTEDYIQYCQRDVQATAELAHKLIEEYDKHPINLQETKAFSPASIGKAYLRQQGINPVLERHSGFHPYLGYSQTAFIGGRTSAHIRKVAVPIVYCDFLSMYPTVNVLLGLWDFLTARNIKVIDHCQKEIIEFLKTVSAKKLLKPESWKHLAGFVRVIPNGDILPSRGLYNSETHDWQVAVNHIYADNPRDALWYSLPDVVASVLLTGRIPEIIDAFRIQPCGLLPDLKPTKLRGIVPVNPSNEDFFKTVIEERKRVAKRDIPKIEKERLGKSLKVVANSSSYGIFAEVNPQESSERELVRCHGLDAEPFTSRVHNPERPGEYCFPPIASLITGAARLMLALLEHCVSELGGTYAMEDTDSMAIVATKKGGLVACPGGTRQLRDGTEAINALSWEQVALISERFKALNPYDREAIPGSILKIEEDNFDPKTSKQRQLWCYAISAKRYALFVRRKDGSPSLLRKNKNSKENHWSEHGLGHLLNPTDPESEDREWIAKIWDKLISESLGCKTSKLQFEPLPAIGRITVSSPAILGAFDRLNEGKQYCDQIKPFNFLLTCHVSPFGHPVGVDPAQFHLVAPYETNPTRWTQLKWINQYSKNEFSITTGFQNRKTAKVKTYGDVVEEYKYHPEPKCADLFGTECGKQTIGLLHRRHVRIDSIKFIGKESNSLEEVNAGTIHSSESVYTEYHDQRRDEWETEIRPSLKKISLSILVSETGLSRRTLIYARNGKRRPHRTHQAIIVATVRKLGKS